MVWWKCQHMSFIKTNIVINFMGRVMSLGCRVNYGESSLISLISLNSLKFLFKQKTLLNVVALRVRSRQTCLYIKVIQPLG